MNTEVESGTVEPTVPAQNAPEAHEQAESSNGNANGTAGAGLETWEDLGVKEDLKQTLLGLGF